jgi:hypothetical protein
VNFHNTRKDGQAMYNATKLGMKARRMGKKLRDNPYVPQLKEHRQWRNGWYAEHYTMAQEEMAQ